MKKTLIALAAGLAISNAVYADSKVIGQVEQQLDNTGGSWDQKSADTRVGVKMSEDLGNGMRAYGIVLWDIDSETGDTAVVRESYVGLGTNEVAVQMGKDLSAPKHVYNQTIDWYEGQSYTGQIGTRPDSQVKVLGNVNGIEYAIAQIYDAGGEKGADSTAAMVGVPVGPAKLFATVNKDKVNDNDYYGIGGNVKFGTTQIGALYESMDENDGTDKVVFKTAVLQHDIGKNKIIVGMQNKSESADTINVELQHNFSKKTRVYVGYKDVNVGDNTYLIGMKHKF